MDRRAALKRTALLMGGSISASAIAGILKGCVPKVSLDWKPVFFSSDEAALVTEIAEVILPQSDTPGAKATGVPAFIDQMLEMVYSQEDQQRVKDGLHNFEKGARRLHGDAFVFLPRSAREEYLKEVHETALDAEGEGRHYIIILRELTLLGFFSSEAGATQVLQYDPVPGDFKGCVPLKEVGKAWAT